MSFFTRTNLGPLKPQKNKLSLENFMSAFMYVSSLYFQGNAWNERSLRNDFEKKNIFVLGKIKYFKTLSYYALFILNDIHT